MQCNKILCLHNKHLNCSVFSQHTCSLLSTQTLQCHLPSHLLHWYISSKAGNTGRLWQGKSVRWWTDPINSTRVPLLSKQISSALWVAWGDVFLVAWVLPQVAAMCLILCSSMCSVDGVAVHLLLIQKLCNLINAITNGGTLSIEIDKGLLKMPLLYTKIPNVCSVVI